MSSSMTPYEQEESELMAKEVDENQCVLFGIDRVPEDVINKISDDTLSGLYQDRDDFRNLTGEQRLSKNIELSIANQEKDDYEGLCEEPKDERPKSKRNRSTVVCDDKLKNLSIGSKETLEMSSSMTPYEQEEAELAKSVAKYELVAKEILAHQQAYAEEHGPEDEAGLFGIDRFPEDVINKISDDTLSRIHLDRDDLRTLTAQQRFDKYITISMANQKEDDYEDYYEDLCFERPKYRQERPKSKRNRSTVLSGDKLKNLSIGSKETLEMSSSMTLYEQEEAKLAKLVAKDELVAKELLAHEQSYGQEDEAGLFGIDRFPEDVINEISDEILSRVHLDRDDLRNLTAQQRFSKSIRLSMANQKEDDYEDYYEDLCFEEPKDERPKSKRNRSTVV